MPSGGLYPYQDDSGLMEPETGTQPGPEAQGLDGLDTQETWGYWASNASEERDDLLAADGVDKILIADLGEVTDPSYVQSLIEGTDEHQLDFTGIIVPLDGELLSGETIEKSNINISFLFGADSPMFDFSYDFITNLREFCDSHVLYEFNHYGFGANDPDTDQKISGKFYGPEINAVAGEITMGRNAGTHMEYLDATFKATR